MRLPLGKLCCIAMAVINCAPSLALSQSCPGNLTISDLRALAAASSKAEAGSGTPLHAAIKAFASNVVKSYACKQVINDYAQATGLPNDIVTTGSLEGMRPTGNVSELNFSSEVYKNVCGAIRWEVPLGLPGYDAKTNFEDWKNRAARRLHGGHPNEVENAVYKTVVNHAFDLSIPLLPEFRVEGMSMIAYYPRSRSGSPASSPSRDNVIALAAQYQSKLADSFRAVVQQQKWGDAELEHFAEATGCAEVLPVATGPDEAALMNYGVVFERYTEFKVMLDGPLKP